MSDLKPFLYETSSSRVYLDHNATTPLAKSVAEKVPEWLSQWGNPSSIHMDGRGPKQLVRESRLKLSKMLNAHPLELIFTSGGSESNNTVIKGVFEHMKSLGRDEYLVGSLEHPSVIKAYERLKAWGAKVITIPVKPSGLVDMQVYEKHLSEKTALVSFMYANNETGIIFPIAEMCKMAHAKGALFHCDAVQALGKVSFDLKQLGVDFASFSGHKFYALKGIGLLYAKKGSPQISLIDGGAQERRRRAGTENTLAIASFGTMAEFTGEVSQRSEAVQVLRDNMEKQICEQLDGVTVLCKEAQRLSNTSNILLDGCDGESLLMNLDMQGFSVSTGAACSSGSMDPSPVLLALGLSRDQAQSSLRLGLGWGTTQQDIDHFVETLIPIVHRLRELKQKSG
ncbi:MAG: cysteine desulfurase [Bdellovibrionales bacterium]|nr:cysteine desulfurase [Bdellovibrionales bacterium]